MPDHLRNRDWPQQGAGSPECAAASLAAILGFPRALLDYLREFVLSDPGLAALILLATAWIGCELKGLC